MLALHTAVALLALAAPPSIDGTLTDWDTIPILATDPSGDASGPLDVLSLRAASAGTRLFVQLDLANARNLASGPASESTLRLEITAPNARRLTIDFRNRKAYTDGNQSAVVTWPSIDFVALPTTASTRFELRCDLAPIGVAQGQTITLNVSGADSLASPAPFTLSEPPAQTARRPADRSTCAPLRIASFNTLFSGLIDSARAPAFARLLDAVNADVYCFQEEYDSSPQQIQAFLNAADPTDNGLPWNVVKSGDLAIASQSQLLAIAMGTRHYGAVVRLPGNHDVFVVTNHPNCCGYIGSAEDGARISQAQGAIARLALFRAGQLGATLAPFRNAPAIVVGDWNLVGSTTPLDLWLAQPAPAMTHLATDHLIGDDAWTWNSPNGLDFWPGTLDHLTYDAGPLRAVNHFMLDSTRLNASELVSLGLLPLDSLASDHLLFITDFAFGRSSDFDDDGFITGLDFDLFVASFESGESAADFDNDGFLTGADFDSFVQLYELGC